MSWEVEYTDEFEEAVPAADRLYDAHVASLKREGLT
jgi:hypothetical protein